MSDETSSDELLQAETIQDTITVLTTRGPLLAKKWLPDGSIEGHGKAKNHYVETKHVKNLVEVHAELVELAGLPMSCMIRGEYIGRDDPAGGLVTRQMANFKDVPHHIVMFDVDGYKVSVDPVLFPTRAIDEYISRELPAEFQGAAYSWQLSGSAGHPSKDRFALRVHITFWMVRALTSPELTAWATINKIPVDRATFHPVQAIYTAAPVMAPGVVDPVPVRMGYVRGLWSDEVDLQIDEVALAVQMATRRKQQAAPVDASGVVRESTDPRSKRGLIGAFCRAFSIEDVLLAEWMTEPFDQINNRRWSWLAPGHTPEGCFITDDGLYFVSVHDNAPCDTHKIGLNAYDLARVYVYGHLDAAVPMEDRWTWASDPMSKPSDQAMRAWAATLPEVQRELEAERASRTMDAGTVHQSHSASPKAVAKFKDMTEHHGADMLDRIQFQLATIGLTPDEINAVLNKDSITRAWRGSLYNTAQSRAYFLSLDDYLVNFGLQDWQRQSALTFGRMLHQEPMQAAAERIAAARGQGVRADQVVEEILKGVWSQFTKYVKHYRQRGLVDFRVDMFATHGHVVIKQDVAEVTHTFKPFKLRHIDDHVDQARVLSEYRQHFQMFDEFLQLLLHARFANDRRLAFLWLQALSSWGKGFLASGVLGPDGLGIICEISTKEIEAALEGKPAGISIEYILRAWCLWIDEFKSAKGELKQLNSHFMAAPKNQLRFKVPLYLKFFTSAEGVDSLAGDDGVEAQFAERFSLLRVGDTRLDDLPVYQAVGKAVYRDVITNYAAEVLNAGVERMRALGRVESGRVADAWLVQWHAQNGLDNHYDRTDLSIDGWAEEVKKVARDYAKVVLGLGDRDTKYIDQLGGVLKQSLVSCVSVGYGSRSAKAEVAEYFVIIKRPVKLVKDWIHVSIGHSQATMVSHRAKSIADHIAGCDRAKPTRWHEWTDDGERIERKSKNIVIELGIDQASAGKSNVIFADFGVADSAPSDFEKG